MSKKETTPKKKSSEEKKKHTGLPPLILATSKEEGLEMLKSYEQLHGVKFEYSVIEMEKFPEEEAKKKESKK